MKHHLLVSETFYSIQGEGFTCGTPAVFLRLAGCNFQCSGFGYQDKNTQQHLGCDTKLVWMQGKKTTFTDIFSLWEKNGWLQKLKSGAHLVITGGEPLLHQDPLIAFIAELDTLVENLWIELETNASLPFKPQFLQRLNQINASPKLENSGEPRQKAYHPEILQSLARLDKTRFKFVVAKPEDIKEIIQNYVIPFKILPEHICLMAEGGTKKAIAAKSAWIADLCKQYLFHYSPRLQVDIWDEVTGV